jgi:hypothetical protein
LRTIDLRGNSIVDLRFLERPNTFTELDIGGNTLFARQRDQLKGLAGLKKLKLSYTLVTQSGLVRLQVGLPNVTNVNGSSR